MREMIEMTERAALSLCPFCDDIGVILALDEPQQFVVECRGCGAGSPIITAIMEDPIPALEHVWNRRQHKMTDGARSVLDERAAHFSREGWSSLTDDNWISGELAAAAACYALVAADPKNPNVIEIIQIAQRQIWPWSKDWFKPQNPRRSLEKAGSLIIAEIDRLSRLPHDEVPF